MWEKKIFLYLGQSCTSSITKNFNRLKFAEMSLKQHCFPSLNILISWILNEQSWKNFLEFIVNLKLFGFKRKINIIQIF